VLVWRRGEDVHWAAARIAAIREDSAAGSAVRDPVIAPLEGLERQVARPDREHLALLDHLTVVRTERIDLPDSAPLGTVVRRQIARELSETNAKSRAVKAAAAWLEQHSYTPVYWNRQLRSEEAIVGQHGFRIACVSCLFGGVWVERALERLGAGAREALLVLNPTARRAPLAGLHIQRIADPPRAEDVIAEILNGIRPDSILGELEREHRQGSLPLTLQALIRPRDGLAT
jgi:hypothetical protein